MRTKPSMRVQPNLRDSLDETRYQDKNREGPRCMLQWHSLMCIVQFWTKWCLSFFLSSSSSEVESTCCNASILVCVNLFC